MLHPTAKSISKLSPYTRPHASQINLSCTVLNSVGIACQQPNLKHFSIFSSLIFNFPFATFYSELQPTTNSKPNFIPINFSIFPYILLI